VDAREVVSGLSQADSVSGEEGPSMSIELEVRSDDDYSRGTEREDVVAFLLQAGAQGQSDGLFLYTKDQCRVEIDLGDPAEGRSDRVHSVGLRVPAGARSESADESLRIALSLAQHIGWRVYDPQRDGYVDPSEAEPGPTFREAVRRVLREAHAEGWRRLLRRFPGALRESLELAFAYPVAGMVAAWLVSLVIPDLVVFVSVAVGVTVLLAMAVCVIDLLGDVHQDAVKATSPKERREASSGAGRTRRRRTRQRAR